MSSQRGNLKKSGPPKFQNKSAFKNVYHDTSKQTQVVVNTLVAGVCGKCKDVIDWKIKYKKYKPLTQPKTCVLCKQKTVRQSYTVYCVACSETANKCAKCGEKKEVVIQAQPSTAEQASEERAQQFELEQLPERKRRTILRLQDKGLPPSSRRSAGLDYDDESDDNENSFDEDDASDDLATDNVNSAKSGEENLSGNPNIQRDSD